MKINFNNNINIYNKSFISNKKNINDISFRGEMVSSDTFSKRSNIREFDMTVFNPYLSETYNYKHVILDLSTPQTIDLDLNNRPRHQDRNLVLDYDPNRTGIVYEKETHRPIKVAVLKSQDSNYKNIFSYHFMSENLGKEFGYVTLENYFHEPTKEDLAMNNALLKDYPKLDIKGPRIFVLYLQNWTRGRIGGIGKLADKYAVKHCLENNIEPIILSEAGPLSHAAHYLRGKRFLPLEPDSPETKFFKRKFSTINVNKIMKTMIVKGKKNGMHIDLHGWPIIPMYLPKELAQKYILEIIKETKITL